MSEKRGEGRFTAYVRAVQVMQFSAFTSAPLLRRIRAVSKCLPLTASINAVWVPTGPWH